MLYSDSLYGEQCCTVIVYMVNSALLHSDGLYGEQCCTVIVYMLKNVIQCELTCWKNIVQWELMCWTMLYIEN